MQGPLLVLIGALNAQLLLQVALSLRNINDRIIAHQLRTLIHMLQSVPGIGGFAVNRGALSVESNGGAGGYVPLLKVCCPSGVKLL